MRVLENGDYLLDDGTVIPAKEIGKLHEKAPKAQSASEAKEEDSKQELSEGQSSGVIRLED